MQLDPRSWHVRFYFTVTTLFEAWKASPYPPEFDGIVRTNLCPYMRRMLVTFPLLMVFYGSVLWFAFYALFYYPATHFGWRFFALVAACGMGVVLLILLIGGICKIFPKIAEWWIKHIANPILTFCDWVSEATSDCITGKPEAPSFCAVLRQWIIDRHHHICRDITIG